ncbi:MAG: DUF1460 domain-containing protein [Nitrospiraceae bacterium]|nr:MAG: DUF1460 domain-containing protein [Nitrospiraceae bacterium]
MRERIQLGKWTEEGIDHLLKEASAISDTGTRIDFLSGQFLNTPYMDATLIGDASVPEVFVVNLAGVDCFTFLDYIEAMRISRSFAEFKNNLREVRYRSVKIAYENRNHFFTDWREFNSDLIEDVTEKVSTGKSRHVNKMLNMKDDGTYFLPGIPARDREITYIPSDLLDDAVIVNLKTGDYAGMYSENSGLDVSHVGILIKEKEKIKFRHASSSSSHRKVVDEEFRKYISDKPGVVVYRPISI